MEIIANFLFLGLLGLAVILVAKVAFPVLEGRKFRREEFMKELEESVRGDYEEKIARLEEQVEDLQKIIFFKDQLLNTYNAQKVFKKQKT